jgi:hypothetical protein
MIEQRRSATAMSARAAPAGAAPASPSRGGGAAVGLRPRRTAVFVIVVGFAAVVALGVVLLARHGGTPAPRSPTGRSVAGRSVASSSVAGRSAPSRSVAAGAHQSVGSAKYGGLPSWLPKAKVPVNRIVEASSAHPAVSIQGDTVSVHFARARLLATAVGPNVPEEGRFPVPPTTPCTFVVTFTAASRAFSLRSEVFRIVDGLHRVHHPQVTAINGGAPARWVLPGQTVSVRVHAVLPTGDGGLEWSPNGARSIVAWDFTVEID